MSTTTNTLSKFREKTLSDAADSVPTYKLISSGSPKTALTEFLFTCKHLWQTVNIVYTNYNIFVAYILICCFNGKNKNDA